MLAQGLRGGRASLMRLVCGNISQIQKQQISLTGTDVEKARVEVEKRRVGPNLPPLDLLCRGERINLHSWQILQKGKREQTQIVDLWSFSEYSLLAVIVALDQ